MFEDGPAFAAFKLTWSTVSTKGVIFANYRRAGKVRAGTVVE